MKLQTQIPLEPESYNQIDYDSKLLLLGSCFSENIGEKIEYYKFLNTLNPFGIMFHPKAIENLVSNAINRKTYIEDDLFFYNEQWHCFDVHSKLNNINREELLKTLNVNVQQTYQQINNATHIIITLGTAWVYRFIEDNKIVANCHKVPHKKFLKELLPVDDIVASLEAIISLVRDINPSVLTLFTVSPVRHIKDGFIENTQSKAHLIAAIHQVVDSRNQSHYFPSYEIMMDELRDYRFYTNDMLHPNTTAINYIWNKFKTTWISKQAYSIMDEVEYINKGLEHKSFNPSSKAHQSFLQNLENKKANLNLKYSIVF